MNPPGEHHSCSLIGCSALLVSRQGGRCGRCAAAQVGSSGGAERSRPLLCDREAAAAAAAAERGGGPYRAVPCRALCAPPGIHPRGSLRTGNNRKRKEEVPNTGDCSSSFSGEEEEKAAGVDPQWKHREDDQCAGNLASRAFFCFFLLFVPPCAQERGAGRERRYRRRIVLSSARTPTWIYLTNEFPDRRRRRRSRRRR